MENQTNYDAETAKLEANLHPNTPAEMKKLILDLTQSADALKAFIEKTNAHKKENSEPENYVAFSLVLCLSNGKKSSLLSKRALSFDDFIALYKKMQIEIYEILR